MSVSESFRDLAGIVCEANKSLGNSGLVTLTWGNVSAVDRDAGVFAIKPSGVSYDELTPDSIVFVSIESGEVVEGTLKPSSDTPTHRVLYRDVPSIGAIVHTHSSYAVAWAQSKRPIPCLGTTHADHFYGDIPVTRNLSKTEIESNYEEATGEVIVEHFEQHRRDFRHTPGVLLPHHGPFVWGANSMKAIENAIVLEEVARMAYLTRHMSPDGPTAPRELIQKHFMRKHGPDAYYGQN